MIYTLDLSRSPGCYTIDTLFGAVCCSSFKNCKVQQNLLILFNVVQYIVNDLTLWGLTKYLIKLQHIDKVIFVYFSILGN